MLERLAVDPGRSIQAGVVPAHHYKPVGRPVRVAAKRAKLRFSVAMRRQHGASMIAAGLPSTGGDDKEFDRFRAGTMPRPPSAQLDRVLHRHGCDAGRCRPKAGASASSIWSQPARYSGATCCAQVRRAPCGQRRSATHSRLVCQACVTDRPALQGLVRHRSCSERVVVTNGSSAFVLPS